MRPSTITFHRRMRSNRGSSGSLPRAFAALSVLALLLATFANLGFAAEQGKVITLGESLSDAQRAELLDLFGYEDGDEIITITVEQTRSSMADIFPDTASINSAFSSTALTCRELGDGLDVTTSNITVQPAVPPSLYAMALVTAGIGDVTLVVAAPALAPARGLTALTGVFESYDRKPCASGDTSKRRQRLALEEMSLAVEFGTLLYNGGAGLPNGMQIANDLVLQTQQAMVIDGRTTADELSAALAEQEQALGVAVPAELRSQLVDFMVRLAREKIDWSTFAKGWTIDYPEVTRIVMRGDGIAIRHAQQTATAEAEAAMTATAEADAAMTATAAAAETAEAAATLSAQATLDAQATQDAQATLSAQATMDAHATLDAQATLDAEATRDARATQDAVAAMTATAAAIPTATPEPVDVSGTVVETKGDDIVILPTGGDGSTVTYTLAANASITRNDEPAELRRVANGDTVALTVDGGDNSTILALRATAVPSEGGLGGILGLVPLAVGVVAVGGGTWWMIGRRREEPFIVRRVAA